MASKKSLSAQVAEILVPAKNLAVVEEAKLSLTASELNAAIAAGVAAVLAQLGHSVPAAKPEPVVALASRPVGRPKKTPAPPPVPSATKPEPVLVGDAALLLKAKTDSCFKAAKAACKAAGLGSDKVNGIWVDRPNGGRFTASAKYWEAYWGGYNAEAIRLGIPTNTK